MWMSTSISFSSERLGSLTTVSFAGDSVGSVPSTCSAAIFSHLAVVGSSSFEPRTPRFCFPPCLFISWSRRLFGTYLFAKICRLIKDGRIGDGCFAPVKNCPTPHNASAYSDVGVCEWEVGHVKLKVFLLWYNQCPYASCYICSKDSTIHVPLIKNFTPPAELPAWSSVALSLLNV